MKLPFPIWGSTVYLDEIISSLQSVVVDIRNIRFAFVWSPTVLRVLIIIVMTDYISTRQFEPADRHESLHNTVLAYLSIHTQSHTQGEMRNTVWTVITSGPADCCYRFQVSAARGSTRRSAP